VYDPKVVAAAPAKLVKAVTINFDSGSSTLDTNGRSILRAQILSQTDFVMGMGFRVEGNTDDVGDRAMNKALSVRRAAAVKDYLVSQGIDPNRIVSQGNGPDKPVCKEAPTPECRAANRRTDIVFVSLSSGN
jgi:OmpA-OmpF porin, OOP family